MSIEQAKTYTKPSSVESRGRPKLTAEEKAHNYVLQKIKNNEYRIQKRTEKRLQMESMGIPLLRGRYSMKARTSAIKNMTQDKQNEVLASPLIKNMNLNML
jgi:hypothetical protein